MLDFQGSEIISSTFSYSSYAINTTYDVLSRHLVFHHCFQAPSQLTFCESGWQGITRGSRCQGIMCPRTNTGKLSLYESAEDIIEEASIPSVETMRNWTLKISAAFVELQYVIPVIPINIVWQRCSIPPKRYLPVRNILFMLYTQNV